LGLVAQQRLTVAFLEVQAAIQQLHLAHKVLQQLRVEGAAAVRAEPAITRVAAQEAQAQTALLI